VTQRPITLPPYTPSTWELRLPGYPVIINSWRSASFPELLGTLPSGAEWGMTFESRDDDEALALLLPWKASGCGLWPLTALPIELAGGVDDVDFRKRLTGTTWTMASEPRLEPVKNGRFNVTIELVYELAFDSVYGPGAPALPQTRGNPLRLNISTTLVVAGLPSTFLKIIDRRNATEVLALNLVDSLNAIAEPGSFQKKIVSRPADLVLGLDVATTLTVVGTVP
jgi:hypothetical protein